MSRLRIRELLFRPVMTDDNVCRTRSWRGLTPRQAAERTVEQKAAQIADDFLDAGLDSEAGAKAWLVDKISAALEEAKRAGYSKAMRKRF